MPFLSVIFGAALIALGLWGYLTGESKSVTALIPAFFGAVLVLAGFVAMVERFLKHAMHLAALVGLVGCALAAWRFALKAAEKLDLNDRKTASLGGMTILCGLFVVLCIGSFIQARRRRRAAAQAQSRL
jgi:uncharacterized membrane protein YeaQ/YmgE (transglycosylase-associated protein family)